MIRTRLVRIRNKLSNLSTELRFLWRTTPKNRESVESPIDSFLISGLTTNVRSEDRQPPAVAAGSASRPDETGSGANLRNEGRKGFGGDEGKGNAVSVEPQLEGGDRSISANGERAATQTRKNTARDSGWWDLTKLLQSRTGSFRSQLRRAMKTVTRLH